MNDTKVPVDSFVKATRSQKKGAKEILRLGRKVYDFRKDLLEDVDARNLNVANDELERLLKQKSVSGPLIEEKAKALDIQLQKSGDFYYHKNRGLRISRCFWSQLLL